MPDEIRNEEATAVEAVQEVGAQMPEPKTVKAKKTAAKKVPSVRTLNKKIKELEAELDAKDLEVQQSIDKALMFQEIAGNAKAEIDRQNKEIKDVLVTLRGSVVNTLNVIDMILGGMK